MENKEIIIDGVDVSRCEKQGETIDGITCGNGERIRFANEIITKHNLCKDNPNCVYKQLKRKEQECEELKKKLKPKLKNAHCAYFDGQTGWCKAKEFIRCNPIGCKLYTIDELSTIVDLQQQLDQLKAENEELKTMLKDLSYENQKFCYQIEEQTKQLEPFKDEYFKGLDNVVIAELAKKSIRITAENSKLEQTLTEIKEIAEKHKATAHCDYLTDMDKILRKISEVME